MVTADEAVLVLGYSGRAAAGSVRRAGWMPLVADQFQDRDTLAYSQGLPPQGIDFPTSVIRAAAPYLGLPLLLTGGMEHDPMLLVDALRLPEHYAEFLSSSRQPNARADLGFADRFVLAPRYQNWAEVAQSRDSDYPRWLLKPLRSGGGVGIRRVDRGEAVPEGSYLQPEWTGPLVSTSFRQAGQESIFWGLAEILAGETSFHALPFAYAGSLTIPPESMAEYEPLSRWNPRWDFTWRDPCGRPVSWPSFWSVWGADWIQDEAGAWRLLEINPRYTAAMELLEWSRGRSMFNETITATPHSGVLGKAIYYAPWAFEFPADPRFEEALAAAADPWAIPPYADLPWPGTLQQPGMPVLTLLTCQPTRDAAWRQLVDLARECDELFQRTRR